MPFLSNPRHEAFAQAYVRGETAGRRAASYLAAGYTCGPKVAEKGAGRLMQDARVRLRIAELQRECAAPASPDTISRGDPMPPLGNPRHEAFVQAYVRGETAGNLGLSYLAAGYVCTRASARSHAWELAHDPRVMRRIAELTQEMQTQEARAAEQATARLALSKEAVLAELAKIAFANMLDYVRADDAGGLVVDLARIDRDQGAAIQEVLVMPARGRGADKTPRVRIRLADKRAALNDLGRHFGLFVERRDHADDYADLSDDELAAKIRDVVGQLRRLGIDVRSVFGIGEDALDVRPQARPN